MKEIFGLYQTDVWRTKSSYVNFGFFETKEGALTAGLDNGLLIEAGSLSAADEDSIVVIRKFPIGMYGEDLGIEVDSYEYVEEVITEAELIEEETTVPLF